MAKCCERCGAVNINAKPYTAKLINTGSYLGGGFRTQLLLCDKCQESLTDWIDMANGREETDVEKHECKEQNRREGGGKVSVYNEGKLFYEVDHRCFTMLISRCPWCGEQLGKETDGVLEQRRHKCDPMPRLGLGKYVDIRIDGFMAMGGVNGFVNYCPWCGVKLGKETDVDKHECPDCGEVGTHTGNVDHGLDIYECSNGGCLVHQYVVYGDNTETHMTDDQAMLELIEVMMRFDRRIMIEVIKCASESKRDRAVKISNETQRCLQKARDHYERQDKHGRDDT